MASSFLTLLDLVKQGYTVTIEPGDEKRIDMMLTVRTEKRSYIRKIFVYDELLKKEADARWVEEVITKQAMADLEEMREWETSILIDYSPLPIDD